MGSSESIEDCSDIGGRGYTIGIRHWICVAYLFDVLSARMRMAQGVHPCRQVRSVRHAALFATRFQLPAESGAIAVGSSSIPGSCMIGAYQEERENSCWCNCCDVLLRAFSAQLH